MSTNQMLYEQQHNVAVLGDLQAASLRTVNIKINRMINNKLILKVQDVEDYNFNYTATIDHSTFNQMKQEQSLEIVFDELHTQIVDLLRDTMEQNMCLRIDLHPSTAHSKLVFYEKSRLKSLIFLTIDMQPTQLGEVIQEMAGCIAKYRDSNKHLQCQLEATRGKLQDAAGNLHVCRVQATRMEALFREQITIIANKFHACATGVETRLVERVARLGRRHVKLQNDIEVLKNENRLKCESNVRLVQSMQSLRLENERNLKLIDDFQLEVQHLRLVKGNADEDLAGVRRTMAGLQAQREEYAKQIDVLNKDLQDATLIIAQKTKTHDEIAKDLVQANTMLVNFNTQYDKLAKDYDVVKGRLEEREGKCKELEVALRQQEKEFEAYRGANGPEAVTVLKNELHQAKEAHTELDKRYKEAVKLNALLTRKLSGSENGARLQHAYSSTTNLPPPSQRSNY